VGILGIPTLVERTPSSAVPDDGVLEELADLQELEVVLRRARGLAFLPAVQLKISEI
jgi:hypothetical protein